MTTQPEIRRELGWLIYGIVLGGILGLVINLWTSYYLKWLETNFGARDWTLIMAITTISLIIVIGFLSAYALRMLRPQLRQQPSSETSAGSFSKAMNLTDLDREEFRQFAERNLTLAGFALTALSVIIGFYRETLSDALLLVSLLLASMLLFFLASQIAYEAERLWHGFSADILHYVGVIALMGGFTYFVGTRIQSVVLTYLSTIFVIIIVVYAAKAIFNLYRFYRDYA